ncbi:MAG: MBL fold metallo-hydrolase [Candidatus Hydrogenedentes bacterium]|nr:MBL fold metallo-hydrolase [Candidatus Hydrogenedentota bacterium]
MVQILTFPVTPFVSNCFVVKHEGEAVVIDPGEATPEVLAALRGADVRAIVNTHCHCDHCGGNGALKAETGADLVCHEAELPLLRTIEQQGVMFGVPFPPSPEPDRFLVEGDTVAVGNAEFRVLHVPGHSPGHIALVCDGIVVAGDVLFAGSIGRTDLPGGNHAQLLESIRTKLLTLPDETTVYPGHGPTTSIGAERRGNPFLAGL